MKTDKETIYLYAGEEHPKVKLTCEREFSNIKDLINYFHSLQDTFYIEFDTCETITENLKLRCSSYGGDEFDSSVPFFILEYDEMLNNMYVWKSEGQWESNRLISNLFLSKGVKNETVKSIRSHPKFETHERRDMIDVVIDKLNVDWSAIDLGEFWTQLDQMVDPKKEDVYSFKSFIAMAVLKTRVIKNRKLLSRSLMTYYQKIKSSAYKAHPTLQHDEPKYITTADIEDQVATNYNSHFKLMAENYETFDLKNWAAYPARRSKKQHRSQEKNRISKVRS
ncbi:hypothetical protein HG535_0H01260 [Zygotorulaspora mrakii]|uniref:Uncharacterized protein n=1 Tax=Zygotorulaspora mrakii TaxID=42260 RepID=A0A7H9B9W8_ZYGMR|nr:uncharacterized protein HG535_0H01260 [Zygotorulaspora mrakii]QLG74799.1 hypothetical protein HG535_0H01260 [Zygotorulaspora mrakii]